MAQGRSSAATAQQEAYQAILLAIRSGRYRPGERLIPETIARELAMSRMPVREAFQRLANEGLVQIRPNRGCVVSSLTIEEIDETFQMRSVLEGLAVRLAMPRIDAAMLDDLDDRLRRMERIERAGGDWLAEHQAFHEQIAALAGRPKLLAQIAALHLAVEPNMRIWFHHVDRPVTATRKQHVVVEAMRTALQTGDAAHAEQAMRDHVMRTAPLLADFLRSRGHPNTGQRATREIAASVD